MVIVDIYNCFTQVPWLAIMPCLMRSDPNLPSLSIEVYGPSLDLFVLGYCSFPLTLIMDMGVLGNTPGDSLHYRHFLSYHFVVKETNPPHVYKDQSSSLVQ